METADYCDYELSLALKDAGFDYPCYFYYTKKNAPDDCVWQTTSEEAPVDYNRRIYAGCSKPLLYQAQKWLREKKHLSVEPYANIVANFNYNIADLESFADYKGLGIGYASYECALAAGISASLELIKKGE